LLISHPSGPDMNLFHRSLLITLLGPFSYLVALAYLGYQN